jgi:hypothetical protein
LDFGLHCGYIDKQFYKELDLAYEEIIGMLVNMQRYPDKWGI